MSALLLSAAPLVAWPYLAPLLALVAFAVLFALLRGARGGWLRLLAFALLAAVLVNPSLVRERRDPVRDVAIIAVDRSQSQSLDGRTARTDTALTELRKQLAAFPDLDTRVIEVGGDSVRTGETDVFGALADATSDIPPARLAGTILLTDGEVHDVPSKPDGLTGRGPFHVLLTGTRDERDRRISIVSAPAYGLIGKSVQVTIRVDDTPGIGETAADVLFTLDGGEARHLSVPVGQDYPVDVSLGHEGHTILAFEAATAGNEITLENNRVAADINAVRDRLKVLLVSGEPYPGERTWRNLLKGDPSVDLVHFTILRDPEKQDATPNDELSLIAFPVKQLFEEKLNSFDLIIFDRYEQRGILPQSYYANIAEYVRNGGALLDASGPVLARPMSLYHTDIGDVIPAVPGEAMEKRFKPQVTALGQRHPVTAGLAPAGAAPGWGDWFRQVDAQPKEEGSVLMSGIDGRPLLILAHEGKGRVAELTSDQIWLWSRGFDGGGPHAALMKRLAHWLMKEPALDETALRGHIENSRLMIERVSPVGAGGAVTVTTPAGASFDVTLADTGKGTESGSTDAGESGVYKIADGTRTAFVVAGAIDAPEFRDVLTTAAKLQPMADATDGSIHWLADNSDIEVRRVAAGADYSGRNWIGLRQNGQYTVSGVDQYPLMRPLFVLVALLGALAWAWRREGR